MDEEKFSEMVRGANTGPHPPTALVERMAARGAAIERGRAAEAELDSIAAQHGTVEANCLSSVARVLVGQMAMLMPLPAAPESVERQLTASPKFRKLAEQPVDKLLSEVRSGRMLKALAKTDLRNISPAERSPAPQAEKGGIVGP